MQPVAGHVYDTARLLLGESAFGPIGRQHEFQTLVCRACQTRSADHGCAAKAGTERVGRGQSDCGARACGNRRNQSVYRVAHRSGVGAERREKMNRPAAQQAMFFEINRGKAKAGWAQCGLQGRSVQAIGKLYFPIL